MKFKKPSTQTLTDQATLLGGGILGATTSNGIFGLIHAPSGSVDATVIKKEENMALIKRGVMALVSGYSGAGIVGSDSASTIVKGALIGVAVGQAIEIVKSFASKSTAIKTGAAASTKAEKFIANSLGLGCACTSNETFGMGRPRHRARLRMPTIETYAPEFQQQSVGNELEMAVNRGALSA